MTLNLEEARKMVYHTTCRNIRFFLGRSDDFNMIGESFFGSKNLGFIADIVYRGNRFHLLIQFGERKDVVFFQLIPNLYIPDAFHEKAAAIVNDFSEKYICSRTCICDHYVELHESIDLEVFARNFARFSEENDDLSKDLLNFTAGFFAPDETIFDEIINKRLIFRGERIINELMTLFQQPSDSEPEEEPYAADEGESQDGDHDVSGELPSELPLLDSELEKRLQLIDFLLKEAERVNAEKESLDF